MYHLGMSIELVRTRRRSPPRRVRVHECCRRACSSTASTWCSIWSGRAVPRLVDERDGTAYLDMFGVLRLLGAGDEPPRPGRRRGVPRANSPPPRSTSRATPTSTPSRWRGSSTRSRGCSATRAAAPVLHRRRRTRRRERAQGRVRLEEPAQRGARPRPGARHEGAAPDRGVPRPQRIHDVADQHRPGQGRAVPQVRLAAHRRRRTSPTGATSSRPSGARWRRPRRAFAENPHDIACFIAEPIQGEGGDHHLRPEFLAGDAAAVPRERRAVHPRRGADRCRA